MNREHEYCDCCDRLVDQTNRFTLASTPFDLPQAYEGESVLLCGPCYNNIIDKALAQLSMLKHVSNALLSRLGEAK